MARQLSITYVTNSRGLQLRCATWQTSQTTHFLVACNGRSEFIEKYTTLANDLDLPDHVGLVTWDHCGQGRSQGRRCHIRTYDHFTDDMQLVISEIVGDKPYDLIAHSMGCLISTVALLDGKIQPQQAIFCSPFFGIYEGLHWQHVLSALSVSLCRIGLGQKQWPFHSSRGTTTQNLLTHSRENFALLLKSGFYAEPMTLAWLRASIYALRRTHRETIPVIPMTILVGSKERVVSTRAIHEWMQLNAHLATSFHSIPKARHELLFESPEYRDPSTLLIKRTLSY